MSTLITSFVSITCDGCEKNVTFPQTPEGEQKAMQDNPWLNSMRMVQAVDGRKFSYCSDECEITAAGAGNHNKPTIVAAKEQDVSLAAQAAARAKQATEQLKSGKVSLT